jgi:hypothetical protein
MIVSCVALLSVISILSGGELGLPASPLKSVSNQSPKLSNRGWFIDGIPSSSNFGRLR